MARVKSSLGIAGVWFAVLGLGAPVARAQQAGSARDVPARQDQGSKTAWLHDLYLREASGYAFSLDAETPRKLQLRREPVMRYTSEFDRSHGEVYVWTHEGRAEAVGGVFSQPVGDSRRRVMHEFHSLARKPFAAGNQGGSGWQPREPGLAFAAIPDAPRPARTETQRLVQMRDMARRFGVHLVRKDEQQDELRLLPQPLYRDRPAGEDSPLVDGAVFAYVWNVSTDPEVFLVIEARREGGEAHWEYALARFTTRGAWADFRKREVWRVAPTKYNSPGMTSRPYGLFLVKSVPNPADAR